MAAKVGRSITLTLDGAAVSGVREVGLSINNDLIDITSNDSAGWRTLLDVVGEYQVNISLAGVTITQTLRQAGIAADVTMAVSLGYSGSGTFTGNFVIASYSDSIPYKDAITWQAELHSTGTVTYTPGLA